MERLTTGLRPYLALTLLCLTLYLPGIAAVPPLDRDEPRYTQATRQMLQSGDYVNISFQDQPRHKKPVGIYWLQSLPVSLFSDADSTAIWPYRLTSVLGAILAVLATFHLGATLFDRRTALIGSGLVASSVLLVTEAHIAKTDAVLLACTVAAQAALARLYIAGRREKAAPDVAAEVFDRTAPKAGPWVAAGFWLAVGLGMLIKGPITPMIAGLTVAALAIFDRERAWLRGLRPLWGIPLALIIPLPWLVAIIQATGGGFVSESVGGDLLPKLLGGQESHGAPPGYYLMLVLVTLWPTSLYLWPGVARALRQRRVEAGARFLLAWVIPAWLVIELVPTKLPHYALPVYPALALMIAAAVTRAPRLSLPAKALSLLWAAIGLILAGALVAVPFIYGTGFHFGAIIAGLGAAAAAILGVVYAWRAQALRAVAAATIGGAVTLIMALGSVAPDLDRLWVARGIAKAVEAHAPDAPRPVVSVGFSEPSLVFMLGTGTVLTSGEGAADHLAETPNAVAVVESREDDTFRAATARLSLPVRVVATVEGFNYTKGDDVSFRLYRAERPAADRNGSRR